MTIVVGMTIVAYKMSGEKSNWSAWIDNAEAVQASVDEDVQYFVAIETDARGIIPFLPLINRLTQIGGKYWTFSVDDGVKTLDTGTRLRRICMGHNLVGTYAIEEAGASHVLFLASDTQAPDDVLPRLLELRKPATALHIPTYCQDGPGVKYWHDAWGWPEDWEIRTHMESCACMMLDRETVRQIKWRFDPDAGLTDDPAMYHDLHVWGKELYVRHDVLATHWPESIPSIEHRHSENIRTIVR